MVYSGRPSAGCQNCRDRHIKCDEARPHCKLCVRSGRTCPGYNKHPLDVMLRGEKAFPRKRNQRGGGRSPRRDDSDSSSQNSPGPLVSKARTVKTKGSGQIVQSTSTGTQLALQQLPLPRSIPSNPYLPLEDTIVPLFINSYFYVPRDPQISNGYLDLLPQSYANARSGSHLHLATLAVSSFSVAAWTGQPSLLRLSELFFLRALPKTREALQDSVDSNLDETLMTVLLLSTYEEIYAMKDRSLPAKTHLRGAVALVNSRRSEQSDSPFSETLTRAVQFQVIKNSAGLSYPVIQSPNLWPLFAPMAPNAPSQLAIAASQLVNLRLEWDALNTGSLPSQSSISHILSKAQTLDTHLSTWTDKVPENWIPIPATHIPESVRAAGLFQNHCDCYTDVCVASVWNLYRDTRIAVLNIVLSCLRLLPNDNINTSCERTIEDSVQTTLTAINTLAADICGTIPYFLGSQTSPVLFNPNMVEYPEAEGREITSAHRQTAPLLGGWYVLSYLGHLSVPGLGLNEEMLVWIKGQMGRVLRLYGFGAHMGGEVQIPSFGTPVQVG